MLPRPGLETAYLGLRGRQEPLADRRSAGVRAGAGPRRPSLATRSRRAPPPRPTRRPARSRLAAPGPPGTSSTGRRHPPPWTPRSSTGRCPSPSTCPTRRCRACPTRPRRPPPCATSWRRASASTVEIDVMPAAELAAAVAEGTLDGLYLGGVRSSLADPSGFLEPLFGESATGTAADTRQGRPGGARRRGPRDQPGRPRGRLRRRQRRGPVHGGDRAARARRVHGRLPGGRGGRGGVAAGRRSRRHVRARRPATARRDGRGRARRRLVRRGPVARGPPPVRPRDARPVRVRRGDPRRSARPSRAGARPRPAPGPGPAACGRTSPSATAPGWTPATWSSRSGRRRTPAARCGRRSRPQPSRRGTSCSAGRCRRRRADGPRAAPLTGGLVPRSPT